MFLHAYTYTYGLICIHFFPPSFVRPEKVDKTGCRESMEKLCIRVPIIKTHACIQAPEIYLDIVYAYNRT